MDRRVFAFPRILQTLAASLPLLGGYSHDKSWHCEIILTQEHCKGTGNLSISNKAPNP